MTGSVRSKRAEESTRLINRDNVRLCQVQMCLTHFRKLELLCKRRKSQRRPNKRTVVTNHARRPRRDTGSRIHTPIVHSLWRRPILDEGKKTHGDLSKPDDRLERGG